MTLMTTTANARRMRGKMNAAGLFAALLGSTLLLGSCQSFYNTLGGAMDDANGVRYSDATRTRTIKCPTGDVRLFGVTSNNRKTLYVNNHARRPITVELSWENYGAEKIYVPAGGSSRSKTYHARYDVISSEVVCHSGQ